MTQGSGPRRNGALRRARIVAFVRRYNEQHGCGPTATQIAAAVGYRGHSMRARHLDVLVRQGRLMHTARGEWEVVL